VRCLEQVESMATSSECVRRDDPRQLDRCRGAKVLLFLSYSTASLAYEFRIVHERPQYFRISIQGPQDAQMTFTFKSEHLPCLGDWHSPMSDPFAFRSLVSHSKCGTTVATKTRVDECLHTTLCTIWHSASSSIVSVVQN
jgi:hypothetical protein